MTADQSSGPAELKAKLTLSRLERRTQLLETAKKGTRPDLWSRIWMGLMFSPFIIIVIITKNPEITGVVITLFIGLFIMNLITSQVIHKRLDALIAVLEDENLLQGHLSEKEKPSF